MFTSSTRLRPSRGCESSERAKAAPSASLLSISRAEAIRAVRCPIGDLRERGGKLASRAAHDARLKTTVWLCRYLARWRKGFRRSHYHNHSSPSNDVGSVSSSNRSSPRSAMRRKLSSHPARGHVDRITISPVGASIWTSSFVRGCSRSAFGICAPSEMSIWTKRDFMAMV